MAWSLKALPALPKEQYLIPSIQMVVHSCLLTLVPRDSLPSSHLCGTKRVHIA